MIRSLFRRLFPDPPPAERLALDFRVTPGEAQRVLDRVNGDERRATIVLLCAASGGHGVDGAIDDLCREDYVERWHGTVEGQRVWRSWQMAQALAPRRWWVDAFDRIDSRFRRAWLEAVRRGAQRAAERATGQR